MTTQANQIPRMPPGAWDSHIHIVDPARYPLDANAAYTPGTFTVWDNVLFQASIGTSHNTIVQPSYYGNDNSALLDALKAHGPGRCRAVVVFDPTDRAITLDTLREWHDLGVRGVRVNLGFVSRMPTAEEFKPILQSYADAVRSLGWAVQMYIPMAIIGDLEAFLQTLDVTLVFDHLGHPAMTELSSTSNDPYTIQGFGSLINLLKAGRAWVKVSGAYRLSRTEGPLHRDMDPLILELFKMRPDRLVYASDWPHHLYEGLDIKPWTEHLLDMVGNDEELRIQLFRDNARILWDV